VDATYPVALTAAASPQGATGRPLSASEAWELTHLLLIVR